MTLPLNSSQRGMALPFWWFKHGQKSPRVPTLTGPFPNGQENAGSWLGTKNALYYCAQSANSISWVLFLDMVDRNSVPEEFACIWQSRWVGIITIETEKMWVHSSCDVFVVVSCRGILNSLIFTKAWSMQAWIPVVSSSLYFWKSVFSFRVGSGCLYTRLLSKT